MDAHEDLQQNEFYQRLLSDHQDLCRRIRSKSGLIFVPRQEANLGLLLDRHIFETHLFLPSPYYQGIYESLNGKQMEVERNIVKPISGFPESLVVKIIAEELHYNEDFQPYRVFILETPLEGRYQVRKSLQTSVVLPSDRNVKSYDEFLISFPEHARVIAEIEKKIETFNESYLVILSDPKFENDMTSKLRQLISDGVNCSKRVPSLELFFTRRKKDKIFEEAWECFVLSRTYDKIFSQMKLFHESENELFLEKCKHVTENVPEDMNISVPSNLNLSTAIERITSMQDAKVPVEKILLLKAALDEIASAATISSGGAVIGTDDMLPIFVHSLLASKVPFIHAHSHYMSLWYGEGHINDMGFTVATLKAALHVIDHTNLSNRNKPSIEVKRKASVVIPAPFPVKPMTPGPTSATNTPTFAKSFDAETRSTSESTYSLSSAERPKSNSRPGDERIIRITRPDIVMKPLTEKAESKPDLGDFLSALMDSDDICSSSSQSNMF